jgi:hypothetical protein
MESENAREIAELKNDRRALLGEMTLLHIELLATQDIVFGMLSQGLPDIPGDLDGARKNASANRLFRKALENRFLEHEKVSPGSAAQLQSIHERRHPTVWEE